MVTGIYKDLSLAPQGEQKITWVRAHMPLLRALEQRFIQEQPFAGKRIALSIHLEAKTAYLARVLAAGGAQVSVTGSNPMSTKDDIVAALIVSGISTFAIHGADAQAYQEFVKQTLACEPHIVIDDGGDLVHELHSIYPEYAKHTIGACEETTTGVLRAIAREKSQALNFPVLSINGAQSKHLFDNRYGTGQSTFDGIMRTTNLVIAGKTVVVAGYGWCGKGCAMRAKGLGAEVIVTEVDPIKALEAKMDGFAVMTMNAAAERGDIFITATGCCDVLTAEHFSLMKEGAIISNTGHFEDEINLTDLKQLSDTITTVRDNIEGCTLKNGHTLYLLGRGALVNIACADGHPAEIMDMSFALQALSAEYLLKHNLEAKVYDVSDEIDRNVAALKLKDMGVSLDNLSSKQQKYLNGYELN
ncbi:adenosylhomocysteinase [Morganella psychrotolerans]|uniref:Adenosylhomocysteinase n=1 Tax=Morganella psychrotolerans TaxID=368603 RepID=A0A1B8HSZ4_9GAMM|nr:adenosylhomocysteinase [Morganella psychrotolerans]OBU12483.1 adenosylhomocysteinase [Morganella psychrotolerans]